MITNFVGTLALDSCVGYACGYLFGLGTGKEHVGGKIGLISELANSIVRPITYTVAKELNLEDYKIHLITACKHAVIGSATIVALASYGIISTFGIALFSSYYALGALNSLDRAITCWNSDSREILNTKNIWLTGV